MTSPAPVRKGKKAIATRQRVLDAAAKVFRHKGYTGTRLTDIAAAADTQAGSLYYHFASREDLVREVLRVGQQRTNDYVLNRVAGLPPTATGIERLREAIAAHLDAVLETGDYTAATLRILGQVPEEIRRDTRSLQRTYGRYWRDLFEAAQAEGALRDDLDLQACRMLVLGSLNSTPDWFHADRPSGLTLAGLEEHVASVYLDGLATAKGRRNRAANIAVDLDPNRPDAAEGRAAATSARILDAAARVFRQNGYAGARLVDIAAAADLQTGSLYYHFDSREDMVTHLIRDAWQRTDGAVRRNLDALPPRTAPINRLAVAMNTHLLSVLSGGDYTSAMLRVLDQVPDEVRAAILPLQRTYLDLWRELLSAAVDAGDIRGDLDLSVVLMLITGSLNWAVDWYSPDHFIAPDKLTRQLDTLVFDGMSTAKRVAHRKTA
jgi:AcrR family transcriptional regulator